MRVKSIREQTTTLLTLRKTVNGLARAGVLRSLRSIRQGRLVLGEGEQHTVFGESPESAFIAARIDVHNPALYSLMASHGMVGAGEAYIRGYWNSPDLVALVRLFSANLADTTEMDIRSPMAALLSQLYGFLHRNDLKGSRRNIAAHYDLGNDFFALFLDPSMMYSAALYRDGARTLEEASLQKLDTVCRKLALTPDNHLLEIGTGWGGLACHAASHYGCRVTTTTISQEQYNRAHERVRQMGLEDRVTVLLEDYRKLTGQYDKLVSIEMIEAVGHEYYENYFRQCSQLLRPNGKMVLQAILVPDQRYDYARRNVDFIKRYIFPGGCLPSIGVISDQVARHTDLQVTGVDDITYDYVQTLADWRCRFHASIDQVHAQGFSNEFIRLWDFYLCYCQGGFMERVIHTAQIELIKPQWRDPRYPVVA